MQDVSFQGWTLADALERTADPVRWDDYAAAKLELDRVRTPICSGSGSYLQPSPAKVKELAKLANDAFEPICANFRELLVNEKLTTCGSRNGPSEIPTPIHAAGWKNLSWPRLQNSTVRERVGAKTKIFNVRVFPILQSARASNWLDGLSLADAFRNYVIDDPEVVALGKRVIARCGYRDIFEKGRAPGPFVVFHWSLALNAEQLAAEFIRTLSFWERSQPPVPPPEILRAAAALADRYQALRRMLVRGQIAAVGTFAQSGKIEPIHRMQWQRSGVTVEIRNGDLCEPENHRPAVRWSGIILELPPASSVLPLTEVRAIGATGEPTALVTRPREAAKRTAGRESIIEALQALWPEGPPRGMQLQQRDAKIIEWQRKNDRMVVSPKTISRYLSSEGVLK